MPAAGLKTKIQSLANLAKVCDALHKDGKRIAHCHGVFDLFHIGHLKHLEAARRHADILIVTITGDDYVNKGPDRPVFAGEYRAELLAGLGLVDYVAIVEEPSAEPALHAVKPSVYVKGGDYSDLTKDITGKIYREKEIVESYGGTLHFTHEPAFSSSNLINNHLNLLDNSARAYLERVRESGAERRLDDLFKKCQTMRILMVGETIIDHYEYVVPIGKAGKENIIATLYQEEEFFAGGVVAAANNCAALCDQVNVLAALGDPNAGNNFETLVRDSLHENVAITPIYRPNGPTVQKTRYVEPTYVRKLFEVYRMDDSPMPADARRKFLRALEDGMRNVDAVVVCDFGHGMIDAEAVALLQEKAPFLAINTQSNAGNTGYNLITKYKRADFICIDAMEARLAVADKHAGLTTVISEQLPKVIDCNHFIVTHGKAGCFAYDRQRDECAHIPAFQRGIVDTVGAGDAFFVMTAPLIAAGADTLLAGFVGNVAGGLKVRIVGHRSSITRLDLQRYISTLLK